ncbi:hypothetical protein F511_19183 [Dorcoceras hygrometricum]|uniref:Uncharacterized protein n=1 Tax=Dorcoceras hygrometricum TaxID=472368 RepID=A0A2Z7ABL2_9LAMI|nr:hypothetical protein F511_19183 [Dorcoceras hygrometricum]
MVVDLIGIYGLKGPYCTLTTTDWFLQALSVIPRGSWGDVARRFTMIRWAAQNTAASLLSQAAAAARRRRKFGSGQLDEENPFVQNSSVLLVQADEGVSVLVVDRIGDIYRSLLRRADVIVTTVGARHKCQQDQKNENRRSNSPGRRLARRRPPCRARASARATPSSAGRAMDDLMSRAGRATRARWASDCAFVAGGWRRCIARAAQAVVHGAARVAASLDDGRASCSAAAGRRWCALVAHAPRRSLHVLACCVARCRRVFRGGGGAVAGRRSGESPAMS